MRAAFLVVCVALGVLHGAPAWGEESQLSCGRFGTVTLYRGSPEPAQVVLFVSGDGGWNLGVVDMARELATLDALVVGIDISHYLKQLEAGDEKCSYPAADFEALSQFVQKELGFARYHTPILVGYSSGATLVYAVLVQAPPPAFKGALSMGFCPELPLLRPLCKGHGLEWEPGAKGKGVIFKPATTLETPWVVFQGLVDQVCFPPDTEKFAQATPHAELVTLPKVGHGYSVPRNWMPQFREAFERLAAEGTAAPPAPSPALQAPPAEVTPAPAPTPGVSTGSTPTPVPVPGVADLPLVEVPASGPGSDLLAVIISGDGGWAGLDREVGGALAARGIPVVGLNSLQYFWSRKTPEVLAKDVERVIRHYLATWGKGRVLLIGYSRGADVAPFAASRLPAELMERVGLVALLGLEPTIDFELHVGDFLGGGGSKANLLQVLPEVEKLKGKNVLCFYGEGEKDTLCPRLPQGLATLVALSGGHHFGGDYQGIARRILAEAH